MNPYIPHTKKDIEEMLAVVGLPDVEALFSDIPKEVRRRFQPLGLPSRDEIWVSRYITGLSERSSGRNLIPFFGGRPLRPLRPSRGEPHPFPFGVLHGLYAVPAGNIPGNPYLDVRVPNDGLRAHGNGGGQRLHVRRRHRFGRGGLHGRAHNRRKKPSSSQSP
jgi:hypothetical protein